MIALPIVRQHCYFRMGQNDSGPEYRQMAEVRQKIFPEQSLNISVYLLSSVHQRFSEDDQAKP